VLTRQEKCPLARIVRAYILAREAACAAAHRLLTYCSHVTNALLPNKIHLCPMHASGVRQPLRTYVSVVASQVREHKYGTAKRCRARRVLLGAGV